MHPMGRVARFRQLRGRHLVMMLAATSFVVCLGGAGKAGSSTVTDRSDAKSSVPGGARIAPAVPPTGRTLRGSLVAPGDRVRTYTLYVPRSLPRHRPVPLLVALHGGLGSGQQFEQDSGFDDLAEANHFIVVYPNGTPIRSSAPNRLVWNGGGCCSVAAQDQENVDDVGFISALITKLEGLYDIDKARVYASGHSNGAILAERLVCEDSRQIVAIGVQAGALMVSSCPMSHSVSVLEIHGTADQNIPIDGGMGSRSLTQEDFPPPVDALKTFAGHDDCNSVPLDSTDPSNPAVHFESWRSCNAGTSVEWAKVTGANHAWMGHPASLGSQLLVGKPYMDFDSSAAIWSFLSAHPRH
jgi:polyhydroxybutyrate depolymerase